MPEENYHNSALQYYLHIWGGISLNSLTAAPKKNSQISDMHIPEALILDIHDVTITNAWWLNFVLVEEQKEFVQT